MLRLLEKLHIVKRLLVKVADSDATCGLIKHIIKVGRTQARCLGSRK